MMRYWLWIAILVAPGTTFAQGAAEAILGYGDYFGGVVSATAGWTFATTQAITVTELGCFDDVFANNPAITTMQVGLWAADGSLLASSTVTPASALVNQSHYAPVPPVTLVPGQTYHLGAYYSGGSIGIDIAGAVAGSPVSTSAAIQLGEMALASAGFASPDALAGTDDSIYAGPNFLFQARPALSIQLWPTNQVRLAWPTAYPGYTLQTRPGFSGAWSNANLSVTTSGSQNVALDTRGPGPKYYRLLK